MTRLKLRRDQSLLTSSPTVLKTPVKSHGVPTDGITTMNNRYWYDIHGRGVDTVAVWTTFAPTFNVGELSLAAHSADVNLFNSLVLEWSQSQDGKNLARSDRNTSAEALYGICLRALRLISGTLKPTDNLIKEVSAVTGVKGESQGAINEKCLRLASLWLAVNAHRAAQTPAQPPLTVDTTDVISFQTMVANHSASNQLVATRRTALSQKTSMLREVTTRVDTNNKRWYKAWQGQFAAGTAQREALSLIKTGSSQSAPGQAVFLAHEALPNQGVRLSFDASRGTQFVISHQGPGEAAFTVLASGLTVKSFDHLNQAQGIHTYKVVGANSAGTGAESVALSVSVAQAIAA